MSSLTDEQKKRIEENRARALAKLAEKKSLARTQNQNNATAPKHCNNSAVNTSNRFYTKPHSSSNETTHTSPDKIRGLSRFEYHRNPSKTSSNKASSKGPVKTNVQSESTSGKSHDNKAKNVNDALMKARVVSGTCVLISRTRFKVVIGFHAKLIGVLKSIPSKSYGMSSLTDEQKKRIEENRARALAKLAEKKSLARTQNQNNATAPKHCNNSAVNTSNRFYTKPHSSSNETTHTSPDKIRGLSRFEYHRNPSKTSSNKASSKGPVKTNVQSESTSGKSHDNKAKNVNDALMKARVVSGTCVLISRTRFKVVIGFHAKLIGVLKSIPSKSYDSLTRTWNFLLEDYEMLMSLCKPLASEVKLSGFPKEVARLFLSKNMKCPVDGSESDIKWDLIDKKLVDSLMPFQKEGVIFSIKQSGRVLLADDMGLGKTIQAIAVAAYYRTKWPLLIVVPSSLRMTWRRSLFRWLPSVKPQQVNVVFTGKDSPNVGLVNVISYDLLVKKIREIQKVGYKVVIVDECHAIKNLKTERTKCMMPLLKAASHVILVSGTPALSRPSELYTQISAVNPKLFPSFHQYGIRYCAGVKSHFGWDYSGSSNMEELQLILEECIMIRRLKKLVLDQLPSKTREVVYLDPSLIKEKSLAGAEKQLVKAKV